MAIPNQSVRIRDLERLETPQDVAAKQEVLVPVASNGQVKESYSIPINTLAAWLLLNYAADKDLSNLTATGQSIIDHKQDYFFDNPTDSDLNTFTEDGIWKVEVTGAVECHTPNSLTGYFIISVDTADENTIEQQARELHTSPGNVYRRQRVNGTWGAWSMITQDMGNPIFINSPTVVNPGTADNQLSTIGQLNSKFADIFKTQLYITEGMIISGLASYDGTTITIPASSKYITNTSIEVVLGNDVSATVPVDQNYYIFIDEAQQIRMFTDFQKVMKLPEELATETLYYDISKDTYQTVDEILQLAPVGVIDSGNFTQTDSMQLMSIDSLIAALGTLGIEQKVDQMVGGDIQNSQVSSDLDYSRTISAGAYDVTDPEQPVMTSGAQMSVQNKELDEDGTTLVNNPQFQAAATDGTNTSEIIIKPNSATLKVPRLVVPSEIATEYDLDQLNISIENAMQSKANKMQDPTGQTQNMWDLINLWIELNDRILALSGSLAYLQAHDFGDPSADSNWQTTLTNYAKSEHPEWTTIPNAVAVKNLWDNHIWIYSEETELWTDNGQGNVADATAQIAGIMKLYQDAVGNNTDGTMSQTAIKSAISTASSTNNNVLRRQAFIDGSSGTATVVLSEDKEIIKVNFGGYSGTAVTLNVDASIGTIPTGFTRTWDIMVNSADGKTLTLNITGKDNIWKNPNADFESLSQGFNVFPIRIMDNDLFVNYGGSFTQ